jgi:hypothetical protein
MAENRLPYFSQPPHNLSPPGPETTQTFHAPDTFDEVHTEHTSNSGNDQSRETRPSTDTTEESSQCIVWPTSDYDAREWHRGIGNVFSGLSPAATGRSSSTATGGRVPEGTGSPLYLHAATRLEDGRPILLLDIGSVGNLTGDQWLKDTGRLAMRHGRRPEQYRRERPLDVSGVGNGSHKCTHVQGSISHTPSRWHDLPRYA